MKLIGGLLFMNYIYRTYKFNLIGFWWTTVYKFYLFTSCLSTFVEHFSQTGKDPRPMLLNTCHTNNTIMIVVAIADKDMQPAHNYEYNDDQNLWPRSQYQNLLTKIQRSILTKIFRTSTSCRSSTYQETHFDSSALRVRVKIIIIIIIR